MPTDRLYLLNPNSGAVIRSVALDVAGTYGDVGVVEGRIFTVNTTLNDIVEINPTTGVTTPLNMNPGGLVQLGLSLTGLPRRSRQAARSGSGVTAVPNGPFVELYPDQGTTLHLDGFTIQSERLGGQLVIDPGVTVKLNQSRLEAGVGSQIIAEGTNDSQIVFSSLMDNRYGTGGTFLTVQTPGGISTPHPGDWGGIYYGAVSQGSIDHAYVAFGGGAVDTNGQKFNFCPVEIDQAQVRIADSTFEHNTGDTDPGNRDGHGPVSPAVIFIRGAQPVIVDNIIRNNPSPAISVNVNALNSTSVNDWGRSTGPADRVLDYPDNCGPLIRGNWMESNAINGMIVRGGTMTTQGVWDEPDIAHVLDNAYGDDQIIIPNANVYGGLRLQSSSTESLVVKLLGSRRRLYGDGRSRRRLEPHRRVAANHRHAGTPGGVDLAGRRHRGHGAHAGEPAAV